MADKLTCRELQVLALVARGWQDKAIARQLAIDEGTVAYHLGNLMEALGASNRANAVYLALGEGYCLDVAIK